MPLLSLRHTLTTADALFHIARLQSAWHGFVDGQPVPQFDPTLLGGYGYSYNLFYGPLPTLAAAVLRLFTDNWTLVVNSVMVSVFVVAGLTMYVFARRVAKSRLTGLLAAMVYMTCPFLYMETFVHAAWGETWAMAFIPLVMLGLYETVDGSARTSSYVLFVAGMTGVVLTHSLSVAIVGLVSLLYLLCNVRRVANRRALLALGLCLVAALGLTAPFTLPFLEAQLSGEYQITRMIANGYMMMDVEHMLSTAVEPQQLFVDNDPARWMPGAVNSSLAMSPVTLLAIILLYATGMQRRLEPGPRRFCRQMLAVAAMLTFMATIYFPWQIMPAQSYVLQFPVRLLAAAQLPLAFAAALGIRQLYSELRGGGLFQGDIARVRPVLSG